ncbi:serine hydrolase domain-containing protein [Ilumatobacter sp.]|uniref:serine hydrolase domain-containing protein n=1 Tax=Ilumatobacter sp. TaxID=1967498 RepID=UPI003B52B9DA
MGRALDLVRSWPVGTVAAAVLVGGELHDREGPTDHVMRLASLAKTVTAWATLVAVEEGVVSLDDPVGPDQADDDRPTRTLRHLLAHAGGYGFDSPRPIVAPERKRIYSNTGIEVAAAHVARAAAMPFEEYLRLGVLEPLEMTSTELRGSPAHGLWSCVDDMVRFLAEVRSPTLVTEATAADARRQHFPSLGGIVPGVGRFDTCPWGLGFEIRGDKRPHWTGSRNSADTFGHFGGAGTMAWRDPSVDVSLVALTDRPFDEWAAEALRVWPELSDAVLDEVGAGPAAEVRR